MIAGVVTRGMDERPNNHHRVLKNGTRAKTECPSGVPPGGAQIGVWLRETWQSLQVAGLPERGLKIPRCNSGCLSKGGIAIRDYSGRLPERRQAIATGD